eukprot:PRCOL_00005966-RA
MGWSSPSYRDECISCSVRAGASAAAAVGATAGAAALAAHRLSPPSSFFRRTPIVLHATWAMSVLGTFFLASELEMAGAPGGRARLTCYPAPRRVCALFALARARTRMSQIASGAQPRRGS